MNNSIIGIDFPQSKSGTEIVAIRLDNGKTVIRTMKQFEKDLRGSNLTLSFSEAARISRLQKITVDALIDGSVKSNFEWYAAGTTFKATEAYVNGVMNSGRDTERNVVNAAGEVTLKIPVVGDTIKRTVDGYVPDGFLSLSTNNRFKDSINNASNYAVARLQDLGSHESNEPTEAIEPAL